MFPMSTPPVAVNSLSGLSKALHSVVSVVSAHLMCSVLLIWPVARLVSAVESWIMNRSARRRLWNVTVGALELADASARVSTGKKRRIMKTTKLVSANEPVSQIGRTIRRKRRKNIVLVDAIMTCCPVFARAACAIVNVLLAVFAAKPDRTLAGVVSDHVDAFCSILALFSGTLVNVGLALLAGKTGKAAASKGVDLIGASGTVLARVGSAVVDIGFTRITGPTSSTGARERINAIGTGTSVFARIMRAIVDIGFTMFTVVAIQAQA